MWIYKLIFDRFAIICHGNSAGERLVFVYVIEC